MHNSRRSFSPARCTKSTNGRHSVSFLEGNTVGRQATDALYDLLMKNPKKRALVLQILSQEKDAIRDHIAVAKGVKNVGNVNCESPTALFRRKALEKLRNQNDSDDSSSTKSGKSDRLEVVKTPVPFDELLANVTAFVEVKTKAGDRSEATKAVLRSMGATIRDVFTKDVTHVVFKDGSFKTYQKAKLYNIHVVSLLWIEAVKTSGIRVPEKNFPAIGVDVFAGDASVLCQQMQEEYEEALKDEFKRSVMSDEPDVSKDVALKARRKTALPTELRSLNKKRSQSLGRSNHVPCSPDQEVLSIFAPSCRKSLSSLSICTNRDSDDEVIEESNFSSSSSECMIDGEHTQKLIDQIHLDDSYDRNHGKSALTCIENVEIVKNNSTTKDTSNTSSIGSTSLLNHKLVDVVNKENCNSNRHQKQNKSDMDMTDTVGRYLVENQLMSSSKKTFVNYSTPSKNSSSVLFDKLLGNKSNLKRNSYSRKSSGSLNSRKSLNNPVNQNDKSNETDMSSLRLTETSEENSSSSVDKPTSKINKATTSGINSSISENMSSLRLSESGPESSNLASKELKPSSSSTKTPNRSSKTRKCEDVSEEGDDEASSMDVIDSLKSSPPKKSRSQGDYSEKKRSSRKVQTEKKKSEEVGVRSSRRLIAIQSRKNIADSVKKITSHCSDDSSDDSESIDPEVEISTSKKESKIDSAAEKEQANGRSNRNVVDETKETKTKKTAKRKLYDPSQCGNDYLNALPDRIRGSVSPIDKNLAAQKPVLFYTPAMVTSNVKSIMKKKKCATVSTTRIKKALKFDDDDNKRSPGKKQKTPDQATKTPAQQKIPGTPKTGSQLRRRLQIPADDSLEPVTPVTSRRSTLEFMTASDNEKLVKKSSTKKTSFGIVCTRLHKPDVEVFVQIVQKLGCFLVEDEVSSQTTHLVAGEAKRTINFLRALAKGCWILKHEWLLKSLEAGKWLPEEKYELTEFSPAVKQCRIERQAFGWGYAMNIFQDCGYIYVARSSIPRCSDLQELVNLCKGRVTKAVSRAKIVVGEKLEVEGVVCVKEFWLLDSITEYKLKPFQKYLMP